MPRQVILKQSNKINDKEKDKGKVLQDEEDLVTCHFESGFEDGLEDICGVISLLPSEFAYDTKKVWDEEDYYETEEVSPNLLTHLIEQVLPPYCTIFKKPNKDSKAHMRPLFVAAKVGDLVVRRVLIDSSTAVNLMPTSMLKRLGKNQWDLLPHTMSVMDFCEKSSNSEGMICLDLKVRSITRPTMFVVMPSKANYNLMLSRE